MRRCFFVVKFRRRRPATAATARWQQRDRRYPTAVRPHGDRGLPALRPQGDRGLPTVRPQGDRGLPTVRPRGDPHRAAAATSRPQRDRPTSAAEARSQQRNPHRVSAGAARRLSTPACSRRRSSAVSWSSSASSTPLTRPAGLSSTPSCPAVTIADWSTSSGRCVATESTPCWTIEPSRHISE